MLLPHAGMLLSVLLSIPACAASGAASGSLGFDFSLDDPGYSIASYGGGEAVTCTDGAVGFDDGLPGLPVVSFCFVIPQGASVTGAGFEILEETALEGFHDILPVRTAPFGSAPGPFVRNPSVYLSDDPFPADPVVSISTGSRTGFRLGTVVFSPFRYNPLSGRLTVVTAARVEVVWGQDPEAERLVLTEGQIAHAASILDGIVRNPGDLPACSPAVRASNADWPVWVAIGPAAMEEVLQPLVDFRNSLGMTAAYVPLDSIYASYTGYDTQEQIRNYLKYAFQHQGLIYALMVGDWGETQRISSLKVGGDSLLLGETTDLYYSDLTRMWDGDGDHLYGENTDWIDYYSDITVGRFSSDVETHVQTMVGKAIAYETGSAEGPWRTSALLCGAGLWPDTEPDGYWGSFICDSIAARMPAGWTQHKLYEYWSGHPTDQIDVINQGVSYVSDQGHGGSGGVYWLYEPGNMITNQNYTGMTNSDRLTILHSMACNPGQLSVYGCSAERLMMWPSGGAIAVMYNANYGWGTPPYMGPSEHLELRFAEQLFVEGVQRIGDMQAAAKDAFMASGYVTLRSWVLQENNYLGDPASLFPTYQTGICSPEDPVAVMPELGPAFPNPAFGSFSVTWSIPVPAPVTLGLYDLAGRMVWSAHDPASVGTSGEMTVPGLGGDGAPLPPGCYMLRLDASGASASGMVVLLGN